MLHTFQWQHATQWPELNCFVQTMVTRNLVQRVYISRFLGTRAISTCRHLGIRGWYLPLGKVADTTLWYQGGDIVHGWSHIVLYDFCMAHTGLMYVMLMYAHICLNISRKYRNFVYNKSDKVCGDVQHGIHGIDSLMTWLRYYIISIHQTTKYIMY